MFNHTIFFDELPDRYNAGITLGDGSHIDSTWVGMCSNFGHCLLVDELIHSVCSVSQDASLGCTTVYTPTQVLFTDAGAPIRTGFLMDNRYWFKHQPTPAVTPCSHSPTPVADSPDNPSPEPPFDDPDYFPPEIVEIIYQQGPSRYPQPNSTTHLAAAHHSPSRDNFLRRITDHSPRPTLNRMIARPLLCPGLPSTSFSSHIITNCISCLQGKMRAGTLHRAAMV